ncbi:MAG: CRISPR-associated protein Cas4 [Candidatus Peregrinibacteria bacterium]
MYDEDELLQLSALQHLVFCERQCALIHIEGIWADNRFTVEGEHLHDRVHEAGAESRGDVRIARGLALRSLRLGLSGIADVVEFHRVAEGGARLPGVQGLWKPFPVEYKRGRPKREHCDEVQLCAQAICLEEMLQAQVPEGELFYGATRHRFDVVFDEGLRRTTEIFAARLRKLIDGQVTPVALREPKCERCSLVELCMPEVMSKGRSAQRYLKSAIHDDEEDRAGDTRK